MIHFDMPPQKSNIIKVLGFGGGGGNAVNHMHRQTIQNVDFIICNTDAQALHQSDIPNKIQLGPHLTQGLGAGANPDIGRQATEESLEEIRRMLEINTKMAFLTAGMGGGTGTGGAPTVARICKELGILTVGIVTTPFSFEGPKRMAQAQAGIAELKKHVDTLLVISNDKLREQYGNLKMKEAFGRADDVLTTATKCITDVINSTGQINVDFSDVCTVMRDGGVAILGSAAEAGENRAERAIMGAINSPLLNDNDISGAKWILLNITSATGEFEFTMDEVETIQSFVRQQAGEHSDVILGMGYDDSLEDKIGITIIATGFRQKDPFIKDAPKKEEAKPEPVIVMELGKEGDEHKMFEETPKPVAAPVVMMPVVQELVQEPMHQAVQQDIAAWMEATSPVPAPVEAPEVLHLEEMPAPEQVTKPVAEPQMPLKPETIYQQPDLVTPTELTLKETISEELNFTITEQEDQVAPKASVFAQPKEEEDALAGMSLSYTEDVPEQASTTQASLFESGMSATEDLSEEELSRRKAQERINRLRNISFNAKHINNPEYEEVPAYERRDMTLHNTIANVEDYYSRAQVKQNDKQEGIISTINKFLHGKKPD